MREPWFWRETGPAATAVAGALAPAALLYDAVRRLKAAQARPAAAPAPVFCVGGATLGGVGKTPFALMLHALLREAGVEAHFVTRGYRGSLTGPTRVDPATHGCRETGDEALLLAAAAPTWVSKDRPAGAAAAARAGAPALILDDGYQNPSLEKSLSILLVSAEAPYGNGKVFPAGPLREPAESALARADMVAVVHADAQSAAAAPAAESGARPMVKVWLEPLAPVAPERAVAFCGIAAPHRFFRMLRRAGFDVAKEVAFPDHAAFSPPQLERLKALALEMKARLVTTEKDFVRIPTEYQDAVEPIRVRMACDDPGLLKERALAAIAAFRRRSSA